jgi:hypothetical protein
MTAISRSDGQSAKRQLDGLINDHGDGGSARIAGGRLSFNRHELDDRAKPIRSLARCRAAATQTTAVRGVHQGRVEFGHRLFEQLVRPTRQVREALFKRELHPTLSSPPVLTAAEECCRQIVELYSKPNMTVAEIRTSFEVNHFDPLRAFSAACRAELHQIAPQMTGSLKRW